MCAKAQRIDVITFFCLVLIPSNGDLEPSWRCVDLMALQVGLYGTWDLKEGTSHKAWLQVRTCFNERLLTEARSLGNSEHIFQHSTNMRAITPFSCLNHPPFERCEIVCVYLFLTNIYCSYSAAYFQKEFLEHFLFIKISIWYGHWKNNTC